MDLLYLHIQKLLTETCTRVKMEIKSVILVISLISMILVNNSVESLENLDKTNYIHAISEDDYKILVSLVNGDFNVPVKDRSRLQKSAIIKFWRAQGRFTVDEDTRSILYYEGRKVAKKDEVRKIVARSFHESKSCGYKKLRSRAADGFAGISGRNILKVTSNDILYKQFTVKFTNKARPQPIIARRIHQINQIDLVDLNKLKVKHKGKTYRYILSLMDVFSRFHWLAPLERKFPRNVRAELERIYSEHGFPDRLQSDNGGEFKKDVIKFCQAKKITMIKSRPYNPKAQGKVERSHRELRKKILYDMIVRKRNGVNWVRNLPSYMKCLNNDKREELGWKSAFEIYFGRKSNELIKAGLPQGSEFIYTEQVKPGASTDYVSHTEQTKRLRRKAFRCSDRINDRTLKRHERLNTCSVYHPGDTVLVRYGKGKGKYVPTKRHILEGRVIKKNKRFDSYKIRVRVPGSKLSTSLWFPVEDIADFKSNLTTNKTKRVKRKRNTKRKNKNLLIPLTKDDRLEQLTNQGYELIYDPPGDGDCQFTALSFFLRDIGIHRSADTLRKEVVRYLELNDVDQYGWPLELYVGVPWSEYLNQMSHIGTYGDELTLRAVSNIFNIELTIVSTLGIDGMVTISPTGLVPLTRFCLGHFAEGEGIHYVVLKEIDHQVTADENVYDNVQNEEVSTVDELEELSAIESAEISAADSIESGRISDELPTRESSDENEFSQQFSKRYIYIYRFKTATTFFFYNINFILIFSC